MHGCRPLFLFHPATNPVVLALSEPLNQIGLAVTVLGLAPARLRQRGWDILRSGAATPPSQAIYMNAVSSGPGQASLSQRP